MHFSWDKEIKTILGGKVKLSPDNDDPVTLRTICMTAVLMQGTTAQAGCSLTEQEKYERYELATKIKGADIATEFSVTEVAEIKKCIGGYPVFGPMIVGPVFDMIEGKGKK